MSTLLSATDRNYSFRRIIGSLAIAGLCTFLITGCSSSGSGKDGDLNGAGINDSNLALNGGAADRFGDGNIPAASEGTAFPDIQFDFDSSVVPQSDYPNIQRLAQALQGDSALHAEVEGHCDKRGTAEYNLALGEERAKAVAAVLVNFGARGDQISTISYGEEIPLDPADNDQAYAKNRRVHFALYKKRGNS